LRAKEGEKSPKKTRRPATFGYPRIDGRENEGKGAAAVGKKKKKKKRKQPSSCFLLSEEKREVLVCLPVRGRARGRCDFRRSVEKAGGGEERNREDFHYA